MLFALVHEQWTLQDPESKPTQGKVLKRDRFQCQAPGCSNRGNLEMHHLEYRSHGVSDRESNLLTLCMLITSMSSTPAMRGCLGKLRNRSDRNWAADQAGSPCWSFGVSESFVEAALGGGCASH